MPHCFASPWRGLWAATLIAITLFLSTGPATADVERIEVFERVLFAEGKSFGSVGPYERLRGRLHFAVDPSAPENQAITDVRLAPRDAQGRVTFSADFVMLRPLDSARGNGRLLYEAADRGGLSMLSLFNDAAPTNLPATTADAGNGFLMEQGYALLATGWNWDLVPAPGVLRADVPVAMEGGKPIFGRVSGEVVVTQAAASARHLSPAAFGYEPIDANAASDTLTVRDSANALRTAIPRERWHWGYDKDGRTIYDPTVITLDGGFKPGPIYALTYTTRAPRLAGLGIAGIRDALIFFRSDRADRYGTANPLVANGAALPTAVYAFGRAQGARAIQSVVYFGLLTDARRRVAFDGAFMTAGGAAHGGINVRFAQPGQTSGPDLWLDFPTDLFPFATGAQTDPVTMTTASVLDRANTLGIVPRLFYVDAASSYWTRAASLGHVTGDGLIDLDIHPRARIYAIAGGTQNVVPSADRGTTAQCRAALDYRPVLRSLLLHLDGWVTLKREPPPSMVPRVGDNSLVKLSDYIAAFPKVTGLRTPTRLYEPARLDLGARFAAEGVIDVMPPRAGKSWPVLVPTPDSDGLDKAGLRMPEIAVPLGTYTGWNLLNAATGAPERLARSDGSFLPFPSDEDQRLASGDPRPSVKERYPTRDAYTKAYAAATLALAEKQLILGSDVNPMIERAGSFYDRIVARPAGNESCNYMVK